MTTSPIPVLKEGKDTMSTEIKFELHKNKMVGCMAGYQIGIGFIDMKLHLVPNEDNHSLRAFFERERLSEVTARKTQILHPERGTILGYSIGEFSGFAWLERFFQPPESAFETFDFLLLPADMAFFSVNKVVRRNEDVRILKPLYKEWDDGWFDMTY